MCMFNRYPELKLFDKGPKVRLASELLSQHGSKLQPTDEFSIAMLSSVKGFQKKHGMSMTGTIDKKTWKQLKKKHKVE